MTVVLDWDIVALLVGIAVVVLLAIGYGTHLYDETHKDRR
jgi:hypothetical protein